MKPRCTELLMADFYGRSCQVAGTVTLSLSQSDEDGMTFAFNDEFPLLLYLTMTTHGEQSLEVAFCKEN
jgi:hypothetical protein